MDQTLEQILSRNCDPVKLFVGNSEENLKLKEAIHTSNDFPKHVCSTFVQTKIIPTIFDKTVENTVRDGAVEIGLHLLKFVNMSMFSAKEQESIFIDIEERYAKTIGDLRDLNYMNWDKLWIFLTRLCAHTLHNKSSVANKLLRVVEVAFRNCSSVEQRLKAYDCWLELIDNASLNKDHLCSPKQIKLLITPLKAKFSRMPIVIKKRFDTFIYLLQKLGDQGVLALREFLTFCFGPFDDADKAKAGKSVLDVCRSSAEVLAEILGHNHEGSCLESDHKLYKPLITKNNFPNFADILVRSVVECCVLLNEWSQETLKNNNIVKCLWRSLLLFVDSSDSAVNKKCCIHINNLLEGLLEKSDENKFLISIVENVIEVLIQDDFFEKFKDVAFEISIHLLQHPLDLEFCKKLEDFMTSCLEAGDCKFDKIVSNSFKTKICQNKVLCNIWLYCKLTVNPDNANNFMWPVRHLQHFENIKDLEAKWLKLYTEGSSNLKITTLTELEKLFLENPLFSHNVTHFAGLIDSVDADHGKDFVLKYLKLLETVLTLPNLTEQNVNKLNKIVAKYFNQNLDFYKVEDNDEVLNRICGCVENLVNVHKDYTVLADLASHIKTSQPKILAKFSKRLMSFLESLMLNEDLSVVNKARQLLELMESKENEPEAIGSRSLRIMQLANKQDNILFGRSLDKSPFLKKSPKSSPNTNRFKKKEKDSIFPIDDKSSDYVKIDTVVKVDVNNMSEHQKEILKKRRDDIPALYQDLTQSQSEDMFKEKKEKSEKEKKTSENDSEDMFAKEEKDVKKNASFDETPDLTLPEKEMTPKETKVTPKEESEMTPKKETSTPVTRRRKRTPTKLEELPRKRSVRLSNHKTGDILPTLKPKTKKEQKDEVKTDENQKNKEENGKAEKSRKSPKPAQASPPKTPGTRPKPKKSVGLSGSDYVKRRRSQARKKNDKVKKVESFTFHVTADSQVPLSESASLTAVSSPEGEKQLTIVIRRSPPDMKEDKKKKKKKLSPSQDVIESSQEILPRSFKGRRIIKRTLDVKDASTPEESKTDVAVAETLTFETKEAGILNRRHSLDSPSAQNSNKIVKRSQSLDSLDNVKVTFTLEKSTINEQSTLTLNPDEDKNMEELPASPITCDTPERTLELLNDTLDISPIGTPDTPLVKPQMKNKNVRIAKLLQLANSNIEFSNEENKKWNLHHSSPGTSRVKKMRLRKEEHLDILTFSREVPSPMVVPSSGILKRKFNSLEDSATPSPKRKRVNFSDPATTEKKIFLKDESNDSLEATETAPMVNGNDSKEEEFLNKCQETLGIFGTFRTFCDSHLKEDIKTAGNDDKIKHTFIDLLQHLNISLEKAGDIIGQYLNCMDNDLKSKLKENGTSPVQQLIEQLFLVPFMEKTFGIDKIFQLMEVKHRLPAKNKSEDHILNVSTGEMNELMQKYVANLEKDTRDEFLLNMMSFASQQLPVNKENMNRHVQVLQSFVARMTELE